MISQSSATGDLAFGAGFGMVARGEDLVKVPVSRSAALKALGEEKPQLEMMEIPAMQTVLQRSEHATKSAFLPKWTRPLLRYSPSHLRGDKAMKAAGSMAITSVSRRLQMPSGKVDLLSKMVEVRDDGGRPMEGPELSAEANTLLLAATDTTAK